MHKSTEIISFPLQTSEILSFSSLQEWAQEEDPKIWKVKKLFFKKKKIIDW